LGNNNNTEKTKNMKTVKILAVLITVLLISTSAFAVTRSDKSIKADAVLQAGGETTTSVLVSLGASGVATQLSSTSRPCMYATVCAIPKASDIIAVGGSTVTIGNPKKYSVTTTIDNGIFLGTGTSVDRCVTLAVDDVDQLYAAGRASSDYATVTYTEF